MTEHLEQAAHSAALVAFHLRAALEVASRIESIVIVRLREQACTMARELRELHAAKKGEAE